MTIEEFEKRWRRMSKQQRIFVKSYLENGLNSAQAALDARI